MSVFANAFELLQDDATEVNSINKRKAKQAIRALNAPLVKETVPAKKEEKKEEPKKTEEPAAAKKTEEPKKKEVVATEKKSEKKTEKKVEKKVAVDTNAADISSPEQPPKKKLVIQRREDVEVRPGKRQFERHSGTGRGKEQRKDGAGKANWGKETDPKDALIVEAETKVEAKVEAKKEGEVAVKDAAATEKKEEEEKEGKSFQEFLKEQEKLRENIPKFPTGKTVAIADETAVAEAVISVKEEEAVVKVEAKKEKSEKKKATKVERVQLKIHYNDEEQRRAQRQARPRRDGDKPFDKPFDKPYHKKEYPKKEETVAQQTTPAQSTPAEAFPVLKK